MGWGAEMDEERREEEITSYLKRSINELV